MATLGVGTADTRHALEIVATVTKPLAELLDALKAEPTLGGSVLLIVTVAEIGEMPFEDSVELIATTRNVPVRRRRRNRGCRAHINIYKRNELPASDRGRSHRPATWRIHQTPSRRFAPARAQVMRVDKIVEAIDGMLGCGVIHGDLSAFNILYDGHHPVIIGFPQSVRASTHDDPYTLFRRDVDSLQTHFRRYVRDEADPRTGSNAGGKATGRPAQLSRFTDPSLADRLWERCSLPAFMG